MGTKQSTAVMTRDTHLSQMAMSLWRLGSDVLGENIIIITAFNLQVSVQHIEIYFQEPTALNLTSVFPHIAGITLILESGLSENKHSDYNHK